MTDAAPDHAKLATFFDMTNTETSHAIREAFALWSEEDLHVAGTVHVYIVWCHFMLTWTRCELHGSIVKGMTELQAAASDAHDREMDLAWFLACNWELLCQLQCGCCSPEIDCGMCDRCANCGGQLSTE